MYRITDSETTASPTLQLQRASFVEPQILPEPRPYFLTPYHSVAQPQLVTSNSTTAPYSNMYTITKFCFL